MSLNQWFGKKKIPEKDEKSQIKNDINPSHDQKKAISGPIHEVESAKQIKTQIRKILKKSKVSAPLSEGSEGSEATFAATPTEILEQEFLAELERFKAWITPRTYLKADLESAGTIISGLATIYQKMAIPQEEDPSDPQAKLHKISTKELYQRIPQDFLSESSRYALLRLIQGKSEQKDPYILRKVRNDADLMFKKSQIYRIILEIMDRVKIQAKNAKKKISPPSPDA